MEHLCVLSGVFRCVGDVLQDLLLIVFDNLLHAIRFLHRGYMNMVVVTACEIFSL